MQPWLKASIIVLALHILGVIVVAALGRRGRWFLWAVKSALCWLWLTLAGLTVLAFEQIQYVAATAGLHAF
jgi:hypothetical protein